MNAKQARENMSARQQDIKDFVFNVFLKNFLTIVSRRSICGYNSATVTCELPAKEEAYLYILDNGYTILDSGENDLDKWFKIQW